MTKINITGSKTPLYSINEIPPGNVFSPPVSVDYYLKTQTGSVYLGGHFEEYPMSLFEKKYRIMDATINIEDK